MRSALWSGRESRVGLVTAWHVGSLLRNRGTGDLDRFSDDLGMRLGLDVDEGDLGGCWDVLGG